MNPNEITIAPLKKIVRCAIYARYSSDGQSPASADDQITRLKHHAEKGQIPLIKYPTHSYQLKFLDEWIVKDEAQSGRTIGREGYRKILHGIGTDAFDVLLVDDLSRLTRELGSQIDVYDRLKFFGKELYSLCDAVSSEAPNARMVFTIKGIVNELGNEGHANRTKRGLEVRVLKGFSSGDICYGYGSKPTKTRMCGGREIPSDYEIFILPEEAKNVVTIFDLKIKGLGCSAIAQYLNEKQIPSTRRGNKISGKTVNWCQTTVRKILLREKYIGIWKWGKSSRAKNPITGKIVKKDQPQNIWVEHFQGNQIREDLIIVPIEKWDKVQRLMAETAIKFKEATDKANGMRQAKQVAASSGTLLAGILFCNECASPFLQITGTSGGYYGCYLHHRKDPTKCSNRRLLNRIKIEKKVIEILKNIFTSDEHLLEASKRLNDLVLRKLKQTPTEIKILEQRKVSNAREIQNLLKFVMEHGDSSTTVKEQLQSKEQEARYLDDRLKNLKAASVDKLLVTPFALRAKFDSLAQYFERDPVLANAALRKLMPDGLRCKAEGASDHKNYNQFSSRWFIEGKLLVAHLNGFSNLGIGGHENPEVEPSIPISESL